VIVVADTSPFIALERIGQLSLLPALYEEVVIPEAVRDELAPFSPGLARQWPEWLRVERARGTDRVRQLDASLHAGEAEAIALATDLRLPLVIDERRGRAVARRLGVTILGTIAVIIAAEKAGLISAGEAVFDDLARTGFYLTPELVDQARRAAGQE